MASSSSSSSSSGSAIPIPLASQLPLIARPGSAYSFTFSPNSFISDGQAQQTTYSASNLPSWATFDASTLTMSGTPQESDVSSTSVTLTASSAGGQTTQDAFTLLVSNAPAPSIGTSLSDQFSPSSVQASHSISSAYALSSTSSAGETPGLRIPPSWSFAIGLQPSSFSSPTGASLFYSALLSSGEPLPSWLTFSNTTLTFTGVTPGQDALTYPYELDVELIASDVWGFSAAREAFKLVLSPWDIELPQGGAVGVNMTIGEETSVSLLDALGGQVTVNGAPIGAGNITSLQLLQESGEGLPSWLSLSGSPPTLAGTPPSSSSSAVQVPVNITSSLPAPSVLTNLTIALFPSYFSHASLPAITIAPGTKLSQPLGAWLSNASIPDAQLSANFAPSSMSDWLSFSSSGVPSLSGTAPQDLKYTSGNITLSALSPSSNTTSHTTIPLLISSSSSNSGVSASDSGAASLSPAARIALAVLGSLAAVLVLFLLLICCLRRTQRGQRVRKSLIGKAYVIDTSRRGSSSLGSPSTTADEEKYLGLGFSSPSPDAKAAVDELGTYSMADSIPAQPYVPHPKDLPILPRSGSNRSMSPPPPAPPAPAAQGLKEKKEAWWTRLGSGSLASRTGSIKKWQISKPISRISRHISGGPVPHPGMGVPAGRGILIRVPDAPERAFVRGQEGGGGVSVRFVQPSLPQEESWTPPPSLAPVPGSDSAGYGYEYDNYGYTSPPSQPDSMASGIIHPGGGGKRGSNPFMHARDRDSNPFRRESYSGFASTLGAESGVTGSGSGGSAGFSSSEGTGYGSSEGYSHGHGHGLGLGKSGSVESERPVRRKDFAPPLTARQMGCVEEGDEDEVDGETDADEEEVIISRAALVPTTTSTTTPGKHGTPKRPRLVDFTSERKSDEVTTLNRLESHKAVTMLSPPMGNGSFRYLNTGVTAAGGQGQGQGQGATPVVGSAIIYDGGWAQ